MSDAQPNTAADLGPIKLFAEGSPDTPWSADRMNEIVRPLNAFIRMSVVRGASDGIFVAGGNVILQLQRQTTTETPTTGGSSVSIYKVTSIANINGNYIAAKPVTFDNSNAETLGAEVNVALPWHLRAARTGTISPAYAVNDYIVVSTCEDGVGVAPGGVQYTLIDLGLGRSMNGGYRGLHAGGVEYTIGEFVHTLAGNNLVTLLWACTQSHATTQNPSASSTTYWRLVGVYGGFRRFTLNSGQTNDDYLVCNEATGAANNVNIYKPYKLRYITTETIAGDTVNYSAYGTDKFSRTATIGSNSEKQVIIPYFLTGDSIFAQYDVLADRWQDVNVDGRAWARKYNQS